MDDLGRDNGIVETGSGGTGLWVVVGIVIATLPVLLFVWPGWLGGGRTSDSPTNVNIEQEAPLCRANLRGGAPMTRPESNR